MNFWSLALRARWRTEREEVRCAVIAPSRASASGRTVESNTRVLAGRALEFICLIAAWVCLCAALSGHSAAPLPAYWTTNAADEMECQKQLNRIHGALQEYQRRTQKLPSWLSDLVPDLLHDPDTLVCPFARRTGNLKKFREHFRLGGVFDDPGKCSYAYEFRSQTGSTARLYKQRQMELFGLSVPIVRCPAHVPGLNLGFDGSLYRDPPSGEWEDIFAISTNHTEVFHNPSLLTRMDSNKVLFRLTEPRKADTDSRLIDLSTKYNALLFHLSQIDPSGKLLKLYPEGVQKIHGVDFDVRGLVHLGTRQFPVNFPNKMENIPLNRKCASIHFLHGATSAVTNGSRISSFIMHFADGSTAQVPIIYGSDVKARWFDRDDESELLNPKPEWISPPDKNSSTGRSLRLYVTSWTNKEPALELTSVDFVSGMTESAPFLLAITVE